MIIERGERSQWRNTVPLTDETARELAARLEHRAKAADEIAARDAYLALLGIATGEHVLDAGCGSGAVTREIAKRVGASGRVVGLDPSPALLAVARELADGAGLGTAIEFREGSVLRLPFPDATFDAAACATVLSHVPNGGAAVPELARVLKSGGRLGVFDFDADMTMFSHGDRALTRRIVSAASDATAVDSWLARRLPSLFEQAGLRDVRVRAFFPIETSLDSFYAGMAERYADVAAAVGAISESERDGWLQQFRDEGTRGPIVAGRLHLFVWGTKP